MWEPTFAADVERSPFYDLLPLRGVELGSVHQTITAEIASAATARLLACTPGAPLLLCRRVTLDAHGVPTLVSEHRYPADRTTFEIEFSLGAGALPACLTHSAPATPVALVEAVYAKFPEAVAITRERLGRPMTFAEKILAAHADDPRTVGLTRGVDYADYRPDRVAMQDATAQMALLQFMLAKMRSVAVPTTVHCDHLIQARGPGAERRHRGRARHEP